MKKFKFIGETGLLVESFNKVYPKDPSNKTLRIIPVRPKMNIFSLIKINMAEIMMGK